MVSSAPDHWTLRAVLPHDLRTATLTRRLVEQLLSEAEAPSEVVEAAALIGHELVVNAVIHGSALRGRGGIELSIDLTYDPPSHCALVTVVDGGSSRNTIAPQTFTVDQPNGRGLAIMASLSDNWEIDRSRGTRVSARLEWEPRLPVGSG